MGGPPQESNTGHVGEALSSGNPSCMEFNCILAGAWLRLSIIDKAKRRRKFPGDQGIHLVSVRKVWDLQYVHTYH